MTWAKSQPLWQQVVIADLIKVKEINETSYLEYARMAKLEATNVSNLTAEVGEPLDGLDFDTVEESVKVKILEVEATQNINIIADGSRLTFNKDDLNIVYGNNASGKSGYTRILKNTCDCRHVEQIKGSADRPHTDVCKAKITYEIDGENETFNWNLSSEIDPALQTIHVFDEKSCSRFLIKENDIKFMPAGMDILTNLANIIELIAVKLREESRSLSESLTNYELIFAKYNDTQAYSLVTNLTAQNAKELHDNLKVLSVEEQKRKSELERQIPIKESKSPSSQRRAEVTLFSRLKGLQKVTLALNNSIDKENIEKISGLVKKANTAKVASEKAKELEFDSEKYLAGTGNEHWKLLWNAAKEYSEGIAYPEHDHPNTQADAKCVLCQQSLSTDAIERFKRFDTFISDKSQELAAQAKRLADQLIDTYSLSAPSAEYIQSITDNISTDEYSNIKNIQTSLEGMVKIHEEYRLKLVGYEDIIDFTDYGKLQEPLDALNEYITATELRHQTPVDDRKYEEQLKTERAELRGLTSRTLLESHSKSINDDINANGNLSIIARASKLAKTSATSREIGVLSNEHEVGELANKFNEELAVLFSGKIKAELKWAKTDKGVPYCEIVLAGANKEYKGENVQSILSEGEQKVVSLAGFFAELSQSPAKSAIVFDDPVTSLDHTNLRRIARRIARASRDRQVIVFTHNIVFANELEDAAEKLGEDVSFCSKSIMKLKSAGIVNEGIDFDNMKVNQRLDSLTKIINPIRVKYEAGDTTVKSDVIKFYRDLRITWERAIEEVLLNRTIVRYRRDIKPSSLNSVTIEQSDKDAIKNNMEKCAQYVHDLSDEAGATEPPDPDRLKTDLEEIIDWVKVLKDRLNQRQNRDG